MMKLKTALALGTALSLLTASGLALAADNNDTALKQQGIDNTASIDQSGGTGNDAGTVAYANGPNFQLWQIGEGNDLSIVQTGPSNQIAVNTSLGFSAHNHTDSNGQTHNGLNGIQDGTNNSASIQQFGGNVYQGNQIGSFYQLNDNNTLVLTQQGTPGAGSVSVQNAISKLLQSSTGGPNLLTVTQTSDTSGLPGAYGNAGFQRGNSIGVIEQNGSTIVGDVVQSGNRNYVAALNQIGDNNSASVLQNGVGNRLDLLSQTTEGNTADLTFVGDFNGADENTGVRVFGGAHGFAYATGLFSGAAASNVAGVSQGSVSQSGGSNNLLSYSVSGDSNLFGFTQDGNNNTINGVVTGDANQAAAYQMGNGNTLDFAQDGGNNDLGVEMIGDSNLINARQTQTGGDTNSISVSINGSNNNNYPTSAALEGDALDAKLFASADYGSSLTQGMLVQNGTGNQTTLTVSTDLNAFATYQNGNSNTIVGVVDTGNGNQAVVAQVGNNNDANFIQSGGGNNIGIMQ